MTLKSSFALSALSVAFLHSQLLAEQTATAVRTNFAIERNDHGVSVSVNGKPFAEYVVDQASKPYLSAIYGPAGKQMTRAYPMREMDSESKEQRDHPHHRGILFGHESIGGGAWKFPETAEDWKPLTGEEAHSGGGDTWHERKTFEEFMTQPALALRGRQRLPLLGSIKHREFTALNSDADKAVIVEMCDYLDAGGKRFLTEERRLTFRATADMRSIDFDQTFTCSDGEIRFDDRKDAGLSIRVPASMAVDSKQGGQIINSEGIANKDAWGKPARWCDYHGPVEGEHLGIAFLNHPGSYRYPTRWHVRTYGLFAANPFALHEFDKSLPDGSTKLKQGEQLKLRHRFLFHSGDAFSANIEDAWQRYAKESK